VIPFIDLKAQQERIRGPLDAAMARVLAHGQYVMGPEVHELEARLAAFAGTTAAVSCANGTDALVLALLALEIGRGDAVFVPSFTFVATVESVRLVGATPVFVDVDPDTFNLCRTSLAEAIDAVGACANLQPKAVIAVDLFGQPADYRTIDAVTAGACLHVIADAAQSFGAEMGGVRVGRLARITTTSFFPAKPLGCYGDGGAVLTEDAEVAQLVASLRNHGQGRDRYDNVRVGLNSRLDTLQAAILLEKMNIFEEELALRQSVAQRYRAGLAGVARSQELIPGAVSSWAQYTLVVENRDRLREHLQACDIPTAVYYPKPNHLQAPYLEAPRAPNGLPATEHLQARVVSLPMHPYLSPDVQDRILAAVHEAVGGRTEERSASLSASRRVAP
jgi:dTDP-4-amino-4,6-dideoxygalactose transaminase